MEPALTAQRSTARLTKSSMQAVRTTNSRYHAGNLAILSTRFGTRVVQVKGRAADICYDWKVEILGAPVWAIDARTGKPAFSTLSFAKDSDLFPMTDDVEGVRHV